MTKNQHLAEVAKIRDRAKKNNREMTKSERMGAQYHLDRVDAIEKRELHNYGAFNSQAGSGNGRSSQSDGPFSSFGEQLAAIRNAGIPGGQTDNRLFEVRAASGLNESTNSEGGFLVQTDFSNNILASIWENQAVLSRLRRIGITGNSNGIVLNGFDETSRANGSRFGGVQSHWVGEANEFTETKPKFRQIELKLNKLTGLCYVTDELSQDASALENAVGTAFKEELEFRIVDAVINGTGVGMPLGILSSGCLTTVNKESGQAPDTLVFDNVVKMWSREIPSSRKNAVWLINGDIIPQLYSMSLAVGTGGVPVYMPANGAAGQQFNTLFGRPVLPIEQCATLGDLGDIILADLSNYIFIHKGGMRTDMSIHVRYAHAENCYRFLYRCDGQPVLASEITPFAGTATQSHFITLEAR